YGMIGGIEETSASSKPDPRLDPTRLLGPDDLVSAVVWLTDLTACSPVSLYWWVYSAVRHLRASLSRKVGQSNCRKTTFSLLPRLTGKYPSQWNGVTGQICSMGHRSKSWCGCFTSTQAWFARALKLPTPSRVISGSR